jgi:hypothetical protein
MRIYIFWAKSEFSLIWQKLGLRAAWGFGDIIVFVFFWRDIIWLRRLGWVVLKNKVLSVFIILLEESCFLV